MTDLILNKQLIIKWGKDFSHANYNYNYAKYVNSANPEALMHACKPVAWISMNGKMKYFPYICSKIKEEYGIELKETDIIHKKSCYIVKNLDEDTYIMLSFLTNS